MSTYTATEILINAIRVSWGNRADIYEFVLNEDLHVIECVHVESLPQGIIYPVNNFRTQLQGVLFELNHVRVNPRLDNTYIIGQLTHALEEIGVNVYNTPRHDSMAVCYRPLGEITENVRFYFSESGHCIFLCPNAKLKAVPSLSRHRYG
ncbi:MAG: hypothetical protein BGO43_07230 [Gammaproteobacteria bacterium 39-13]|nr:hypothetical protein [Gammaproteobacteria bacterium]OJV88379.1 MAG: hypothetical protein BGO43_07230 [Gammaproteobacteria bacterium 39-13]